MKLNISDIAIKEINKIKFNSNIIRISLLAGGCNGYTIEMYFSDIEPTQEDYIFYRENLIFLVDKKSALFLDDASLDYIDAGLLNRGFKWNIKKSTGKCGCGTSFSF